MAYSITESARSVVAQRAITPQIVVQIDGYPDLLTSATIAQVGRYGGEGLYYGKPGFVYGGSVEVSNQQDYISLNGTSSQITQQLLQDDGAASSTTQMTIALVNKDNLFQSLYRPVGNDDLISKKAVVYLGAQGMSFPEDYLRIFVGNVTDITLKAGLVNIGISHPENEKRSEIFQKVQTELDGDITNSATSIDLVNSDRLLIPSDLLKTYVKINNEIIRYTGITGDQLTGCTRGQLGTIAASHDDGDSVESFYVLGDGTNDSNALTLALKVLISKTEDWLTDSEIETIGVAESPGLINSFYFSGQKLVSNGNLRPGDFITVTGATTPGNNLTAAEIIDVIEDFDGTRVVVADALSPETTTSAVANFKSQYDTLPDGLGLQPDQVDIDEFDRLRTLYSATFLNYEFYLKDTVTGKELVNKEIFFPSALYSIPRKGQISVGKTAPPISSSQPIALNESTVLNPSDLSITRSSLTNFYNAVNYQYDENVLDDRLLSGRVVISASSNNRIKVKNRVYNITARGVRRTSDNENVIERNALRILDRYQFGAESIRGIKVSFGVGWGIEVGDAVVVEGLQLLDSKTGETRLSPRVMEVTNRSFNFRQGIIQLDVTDTAFSIQGRYGVLSPSSIVGEGSTSTEVMVVKSFGTGEFDRERTKWDPYVGQPVMIHREDWSEYNSVTFLGFSPSNDNMMLLSPGLGFTPGPGDIVDIPLYPDASAYQKAVHPFQDPQGKIISPTVSETQFHTDSPSVFFPGAIVKVHSPDFSDQSNEVTVTDVVGSLVSLDSALGYVPNVDDEIELIGFVSDEGLPYRIL